MHYIIVDLEATCWEKPEGRKNEIIEIGAVAINEQQEVVGEIEQFVKPTDNPILSEFCKTLTSITQKEVDGAPHFPEALQNFQDWIASFDSEYLLCSWGRYDKNQFKMDCIRFGIDHSWTEAHISLKHQHPNVSNNRRLMGMKGALAKEGFELEGTHHRGIDDAWNIAKIFLKYFDQWERP